MLALRLPFRAAAVARVSAVPTPARVVLSPSVVAPVLARSYATPAKPKKGSIGAGSARGTTKKPKKIAPPKTEEQLAAIAARKEKAKLKKTEQAKKDHIKQLKADALSPPSSRSGNAYSTFMKARWTNHSTRAKEIGLAAFAKETAEEYKSLSSSEIESYTRQASQAASDATAALSSWIAERTPDEIRRANAARASLRRLKVPGSWRAITDERLVQKPASAFIRYLMATRDAAASLVDSAKEAGQRWKSLAEGEKQKYVDEYNQDYTKYEQSYQETYGVAPPKRSSKSPSPPA